MCNWTFITAIVIAFSGANIHSACFISITTYVYINVMHLKLHEVQRLDLALIHNRISISVSDKNPWFVCIWSWKDYETFPYLYDFLPLPPPLYATPFTVWNHAFYIKNDTFDDKHVLYNRWRLVYVHVVFGHGSVSAPSCVRTSRKLEVVLNQRISIKMFWAVNT